MRGLLLPAAPHSLIAVVRVPDVKVVAVSDVYQPHRPKGLERSLNPDGKAYVDYRDLLADPNLDALVIATPDHWHCQMVLDAVETGKDIDCEKGSSRTLEEARRMRDERSQDQFHPHGFTELTLMARRWRHE